MDAAHANELRKWPSTTGLVYTFWGDVDVYKLIKQLITVESSAEGKFIASHTAVKFAWYLWMILKQFGYEETKPTEIHIDNIFALEIINGNPPLFNGHIICIFVIL